MNENPPKLNREQTINVAIQKIVANPKSRVLFIIEHEHEGVEMLHTEDSYTWLLGISRGFSLMVETAYVERIRESVKPSYQDAKQDEVVQMSRNLDKESSN